MVPMVRFENLMIEEMLDSYELKRTFFFSFEHNSAQAQDWMIDFWQMKQSIVDDRQWQISLKKAAAATAEEKKKKKKWDVVVIWHDVRWWLYQQRSEMEWVDKASLNCSSEDAAKAEVTHSNVQIKHQTVHYRYWSFVSHSNHLVERVSFANVSARSYLPKWPHLPIHYLRFQLIVCNDDDDDDVVRTFYIRKTYDK